MKKTKAKKKAGRPARFQEPRTSIAARLQAALHDRIKNDAVAAGLSISEEIERRLNASFARQDALGGPAMERMANLMSANFYAAGSASAGKEKPSAEDWLNDPVCFRDAMMAVMSTLMDLHRGDIGEKTAIYQSLMGRAATHIANPKGNSE